MRYCGRVTIILSIWPSSDEILTSEVGMIRLFQGWLLMGHDHHCGFKHRSAPSIRIVGALHLINHTGLKTRLRKQHRLLALPASA